MRVHSWKLQLSMNRNPSPHPSPPVGERVPEGRVRGILRGSWSQCAVAEPWRLSIDRRICRQVLECGDGVREVTALAVTTLKIPKPADDTAPRPKAATAKTPSPQSKTLARQFASPGLWPTMRVRFFGG
jgi:hypothetical protein